MPDLAVVAAITPQQEPITARVLATPVCVTVAPDGSRVFVVCQANDSIVSFRRNREKGTLTFESSTRNNENGATGFKCLTWCVPSPDGKHLYATSAESIVVAFAVK